MVREQQPWLDVPFGEKDDAKAAGAQWDWRAKRWYAPRPGMPELARWLPVPAPAGPPPADEDQDLAARTPGPADDRSGRSWPAGAEGEVRLAEALRGMTEAGPLAQRRPPWRVLHAVPTGPGHGDLDHVLLGPPGLVVVNTEHHHGRAVRVDGDRMTVDREPVDHVPRIRAEAERAGRLLGAARSDDPGVAPPATGALAVVAASVTTAPGGSTPEGVLVATPAGLPRLITALPAVLADDEIDELYAVARRLGTWTREL
ncbi:nuclease-like protein [Actinomycetospora succinea]|uniref:Nuclease-like protein n=1 Tax=Actinomycetospora succinea TaxID=663603 RepID=A0A4R6VRD3_9PSEU|nr:DUF5710 domain-containing protein [Actinomycetospora succinea]TDQ65020.1 nuclease-like protein [Actinomycetospora succinea]